MKEGGKFADIENRFIHVTYIMLTRVFRYSWKYKESQHQISHESISWLLEHRNLWRCHYKETDHQVTSNN